MCVEHYQFMCCGLKAYLKDMWLCPECTSCISRRGFAIWWIRRAPWRGRLLQMLVSAESSELPCKCDASSSGTENFFEKHLNWQAYDIVNMQLAPPCRYSGWNVVFDPYTLTTGKIYYLGGVCVQSIWWSLTDYLYDIVNTVSTRRGTARNATEDNSAVGQTVTVSGTKKSKWVCGEIEQSSSQRHEASEHGSAKSGFR